MRTIRATLIVILAIRAATSMTLAAPVQPQFDEPELVAKLCGRLERSGRIAIKDAKLAVYERRSKSPCCATTPVVAETLSNKSGAFEFKGLPSGDYWLVANIEKQEYRMDIRVGQSRDKQPVCSEMSFMIDAAGELVLRVRAPGR